MGYIEKSLGANERVIAIAHYHWLYRFGAILALVFLGWVVIGIFIFLSMMIRSSTTEIGVTTHRFIKKTGWLSLSTNEIALQNIEGARVRQTILGRIFDYGHVIIEGTGVDAVETPMIADPIGFRRAIETAKGGPLTKAAP
jgi:uncharacterized membrane protein YdbT with pleckstrin-like domain